MKIEACRSCNSSDLVPVLNLGDSPLANALLRSDQLNGPENRFPLNLVFCKKCALVQITETVAPDILFRDYVYFSSVSDTVVENARSISMQMLSERALGPDSNVVEIASNDGYLLQFYKTAGVPILGIEPALNIAHQAQDRGIPTVAEFFNEQLALSLKEKGIQADVFHANNVLAHVADLNGVVAGMSILLKPDGVGVIEFPYVKDLIDNNEFDTIYHEHLCYFSLTSVERLFNRHAMKVINVERIPIHGGSLRLFVSLESSTNKISSKVITLREEEHAWGVDDASFYQSYGKKVEDLRSKLLTTLNEFKRQGCSIAAYGASAKGTTLLSTFGIGSEMLDYVVDRSPVKQGLFTPGSHLPIFAPEILMERKPDYVLLLTWNFADEILGQQKAYSDGGGKFIIPIPEVKVV